MLKLKDIIELINPYLAGYRVGLVDKIFVDFESLYAYLNYYVVSISAHEEEGYGAIISIGLMTEEELKK